ASALTPPAGGEGMIAGADRIKFKPGKDQVVPDSLKVLDELVARVKASPGTRLIIRVSEEKKRDKYSETVAKKRADALLGYLVGFGVEPERLSAEVGG